MAEESPTGSVPPPEGLPDTPSRRRRKKPMSLDAWREKKYGIDAQWRSISGQKSSPSFTMRPKTSFGTMLSFKTQTSGYKGRLDREFAFTKKGKIMGTGGFSMGAKPLGHCFEVKSPGPAEYRIIPTNDPNEVAPNYPRIPGGRFNTGSITLIPEKCPGPGDYAWRDYVSSLDGNRPPRWSIRGQLPGGAIQASSGSGLGPGVYDISKTLSNGKITSPQCTLLGRDSAYNPEVKIPGAGAYSPGTNSPIRRMPSYSFGFTARFSSEEKPPKRETKDRMRQTH